MVRRLAVLCRYLPDSTKSSGELRFDHILRHLASRAGEVRIFAEHHGNRHRFPDLAVHPMSELGRLGRGSDLAFLEFWFMAKYLRTVRPWGAPTILDSVDVEFVRRARERHVMGEPAGYWRLEKRREVAAYRKVDQVWAVSDADAAHIRHLAAQLVVVPNIFDAPADVPAFSARRGICFVGSFSHQPNVDGLRWYRDHIYPHLQDIPHTIVGHGAPDDLAAMPGFVGGVPDSSVCVRAARVSVAPLRYGAGLKGKVLEAWACGTPVVTTAMGDEGYAGTGTGAAVATDDPLAFAQAVRELVTDESAWSRMSERGRAVARQYAPSVVTPVIDQALASVLATRTLA